MGEYYDIPLVRAFCKHVGFEDVKCVPARKLDEGRWTVGIVATKPSLKSVDERVTSTRERVNDISIKKENPICLLLKSKGLCP